MGEQLMYEFKEEDAYNFARHINAKTLVRGRELVFKECPYCHGKGMGNKEKFSINLDSGAFNCLRASCNAHGNMITLSKDFDFSLGNIVDEYYRPKKEFRTFKKPEKPIEPKEPAIAYLQSRGISENVAKRYQITTKEGQDNILTFPFFDEKGNLPFIKYRKTDFNKEKDKNKEWCEKNCKPILFGMYQCNPENKTLIITEGQLDSLSVAQSGIENAVSVPTGAKGFTWIPYCWDWMQQFDIIIVFGDHEKGHITLLDEIKQRFPKKHVKHVREEDYKDCKDANDLLRKYGESHIRTCIQNAIDMPVKQIRDLSDVESVNIYDLKKLPTGIYELDRLLKGGLPYSGVTLIAGKPGEGKSSFASQILANALNLGHKCFAYSGELPNYLFKAWLDYQIAGKNHIISTKTKFGDDKYFISNGNIEYINSWYKGRMFIYDDGMLDDEQLGLMATVEKAIVQYGCDVILIDNLMTGLDLERFDKSDKYEKQSLFVKRIVALAKAYDVIILLVAHKRKNNFSANDNDEISGSGDISNLGMITLTYERGSQNDIDNGVIKPEQRRLKLSKNRLFGIVDTNGWILDFEPKSRRIYGKEDNPDIEYGWTKLIKTDYEYTGDFTAIQDADDIPFD